MPLLPEDQNIACGYGPFSFKGPFLRACRLHDFDFATKDKSYWRALSNFYNRLDLIATNQGSPLLHIAKYPVAAVAGILGIPLWLMRKPRPLTEEEINRPFEE